MALLAMEFIIHSVGLCVGVACTVIKLISLLQPLRPMETVHRVQTQGNTRCTRTLSFLNMLKCAKYGFLALRCYCMTRGAHEYETKPAF